MRLHTLTTKQAEQERLVTQYRVKYHEADRALRRAQVDLGAPKAWLGEEHDEERRREDNFEIGDDDFEGDDDAHEVMDKV